MPLTLSVLVPVYNERATIERLLHEVVAVETGLTLEVLVGDDGSIDGTREILSRINLPGVTVVFMPDNVGRGGVLKHLWTLATGEILVHQDADLEYDPRDYNPLLRPLLDESADVVYGSRFKGSIERMRWVNRVGNLTLSAAARSLYGAEVSDLMTCYKMYRASLIQGLTMRANGFEFEAEFLARLAQRGARFAEVPVSFRGRTVAEGKKIHPFDAVRVIKELIRCKVSGEPRG